LFSKYVRIKLSNIDVGEGGGGIKKIFNLKIYRGDPPSRYAYPPMFVGLAYLTPNETNYCKV